MKKSLLFLALSSGLFFAGCSPKYYTPNTQNVPLISKKGEINLTAAGNGSQVEVQGAYGVTNAFAIQANTGFFFPQNEDNGDGGSGKFIELGGGYFKPLQNNFVFEIYGLLGFGGMENHFPSTVPDHPATTGKISGNIFRYGIQPNIGYKSKYFSAAISSRFVNLNYSNIKGNLIFDGHQQAYLTNNNSNFLIEPAITLRGGIEKIKLQIQYGWSFNVSNSNFKQDRNLLTIGVNLNLH